jgi:autotransporter-associated beta strand protein
VSNSVIFAGGTLQFGPNNIFDYSSRFSTASNQIYQIDTGGQTVALSNNLSSSGGVLNKVGSGTLVLAGTNTYTGLTTVSSGRLLIQGLKTGLGNITVQDGATLAVSGNGAQVVPGVLTLGSASGAILEFNSIGSTVTAPIVAGELAAAGTLTVNVNSGTFAVGQSYPLLSWTTGSAPTVNLATLNGFIGNLSVSGNTLTLKITGTAYLWTGTNNANWDTTTPNNWVQNGAAATFANGGPVLFDDTVPGATNITVKGVVQPSSITVNNNTKIYSISSSSGNNIGGTGGLTKSGAAALQLSGGVNAYTVATTINGGILSVASLANGGLPSDIGAATNSAGSLVLNGGTLQYLNGSAVSSDHLFTLGPSGGALDASGAGALNLSNPGLIALSGSGPRILTLTGAEFDTNTLAATLPDSPNGVTSLTKTGSGIWVLTGNNTYTGATTVGAGTLQIGNGGTTGTVAGSIVDNATLIFNRSNNVTIGVISGSGAVQQQGAGTLILSGNNTYTGGTTIGNGTLQVGTGGAAGSLDGNSPIVNNGVLVFNSTGAVTLNAGSAISGTGQLVKQGSGLLKLIGAETYTGGTTIASGAQLQISEGNQGSIVGNITNNGSLLFVRQDNGTLVIAGNISGSGSVSKDVNNANAGDVTFTGTNTYTGGTFIRGGGIVLGDGATAGAGSIVGNVVFTNSIVSDDARSLEFNRPDDTTFSGNISGSGSTANPGTVIQNAASRLTLTGTNTYTGGTTINTGIIQVGAGGTVGGIGTGPVTDNGELDFDRSDVVNFGATISGGGSVMQIGSGTLILSATNNSYSGATTVSNGTLVINSVPGDLNVIGGSVTGTASNSTAGVSVAGNLNISNGMVIAYLNKSLPVSNTVYTVGGTVTRSGGSLQLVNAGPAVAAGDKFTIFSSAVAGGAAMTILSPGLTVTNKLAVDGSVVVTGISSSVSISTSVSGGQLTLSWPGSSGLHLQAQTNPVSVGLSTNWVTIPGSNGTNSFTTPLVQSNGTVFFRLAP